MRRFEYKASDRLAHDRLARYSLRSKLLVPFQDLDRVYGGGFDLRVGNVVPGEPIGIRWRVVLGLQGTDSTSFSLRLLIDGKQVHERDNIPVKDASVGGVAGTLKEWRDEALQDELVVIRDPNDARVVYAIGAKTLTAEVRGDGGATPEFVGSTRFRVVRETVDSSWWEWRGPQSENIEWKKAYALVGDFVNRSRFASIATVNAELSEVRSDEDPLIEPCDYVPIKIESRDAIAAGARTGFSFSLLHDWSWLMTATYVIYGVTVKLFAYAVFFHFTDEFGNVYQGACSSRVSRQITVSKVKIAAAATAQLAAANALVLALAAAAALAGILSAPLAVPLFAAAAISYGVAAAAGEVAKDPPEPDPRYREPVEVVPLPLPPFPKDDEPASLASLLPLLRTGAELMALENARTVCRARLLGARLAGDDEALERQRASYLQIERQMVQAADTLDKVLPDAQTAAEKDDRFAPQTLEPWIDALSEGGFSENMQSAMNDAGLRPGDVNGLAALFRSPVLVELLRSNGLFLASFVSCLRDFVAEVQSERDTVLERETYVELSERDFRRPDERLMVDEVGTLRPGRKERSG